MSAVPTAAASELAGPGSSCRAQAAFSDLARRHNFPIAALTDSARTGVSALTDCTQRLKVVVLRESQLKDYLPLALYDMAGESFNG